MGGGTAAFLSLPGIEGGEWAAGWQGQPPPSAAQVALEVSRPQTGGMAETAQHVYEALTLHLPWLTGNNKVRYR